MTEGYIGAAAGIIGIPVSGGSMNSARPIGPALVSFNLSYDWIYWIAPIIGAILAVLCFRVIKDHRAEGISDSSYDDQKKAMRILCNFNIIKLMNEIGTYVAALVLLHNCALAKTIPCRCI